MECILVGFYLLQDGCSWLYSCMGLEPGQGESSQTNTDYCGPVQTIRGLLVTIRVPRFLWGPLWGGSLRTWDTLTRTGCAYEVLFPRGSKYPKYKAVPNAIPMMACGACFHHAFVPAPSVICISDCSLLRYRTFFHDGSITSMLHAVLCLVFFLCVLVCPTVSMVGLWAIGYTIMPGWSGWPKHFNAIRSLD